MNKNKKKSQQFVFSSKANVLESIKNSLTKSKIEKLFHFTVDDWNHNSDICILKIQNLFSNKIIIRSSSFGEDSVEKSEAGKFLSIQNINPKSKSSVKKAINNVIKSYDSNNKLDSQNQVLIQTQTKNVQVSGVLFTKTLENGSPYYVINFEDGASTDSVTKGSAASSVKIHNTIKNNYIPQKWRKLLSAVKEIEYLTNNEQLDIEFAITDSEIIIFQIRPLTTIKKNPKNILKKYVEKEISKNSKKFLKIKSKNSKINKKIIFSNMTDWNPAEIIGNKPRMFDFSLYDYLIMNDSWVKGRYNLGYAKIKNSKLMEDFSGYPYVNVQSSFYSFFPIQMKSELRKKLMNFYLKKLESNPHLHDKVEFEILFTCYDFSLKKRLKELKNFGFTITEINSIRKILKNFTNQIIEKTPHILKETENYMKLLNEKRSQSNIKNDNYKNKLKNAELLLNHCKKYGAIQFSTIARLAFISTILVKTLCEIYNIKKETIEKFMNSISTPVTEFQNDLYNLKKKKINKKSFLDKYGHLRPGTYDMTIPRYDQITDFLENLITMNVKKPIHQQSIKNSVLEKLIQKHGLHFNELGFFEFVQQTISFREETKFEFTKSLSDVIELIVNAGNSLGFSRDDLSYLTLNDIKKYKMMNKNQLKNYWKNKIEKNKKHFEITNYVQLPPIIFSENDFRVINHYIAQPNYITDKKITSPSLLLDNLENILNIESKIVLIENADPGFDWIFSKKPSGLITKYGGIASHMAIRCAELGLPAAIGCGEILFNKLKISSIITLDCKNEDIVILEYKQKNDFSEEKKLLKSLGYIR